MKEFATELSWGPETEQRMDLCSEQKMEWRLVPETAQRKVSAMEQSSEPETDQCSGLEMEQRSECVMAQWTEQRWEH
jgi:hypothetical protein